MYPRNPSEESYRYLIFVLLHLEIFYRPQLLKRRRLLAFNSSLFPLSDVAVDVLQRQKTTAKRKKEFIDSVFVYRGRPVHQTGTIAWKNALKKVDISDFRWHVQRGTPPHVLKEIGGWETMEMVQRYAHLSADHLVQWLQSVSNDGCNLATVG